MWTENWFSLGRNLNEVNVEMARLGYNYDRTAVSHALVDLVREGYLSRSGRPRNYMYIQKKPPSE